MGGMMTGVWGLRPVVKAVEEAREPNSDRLLRCLSGYCDIRGRLRRYPSPAAVNGRHNCRVIAVAAAAGLKTACAVRPGHTFGQEQRCERRHIAAMPCGAAGQTPPR